MGKIDKEREEIAWIKFWIGVAVASIMGLISWLVNHYEAASTFLIALDIIGIAILGIFILFFNRIGLKKIKELEDIE